ncbi:hypothetical protein [Nocardioides sp. ChNu-99]|uniref:hypothetical protein n=1 Tax=Nocardioides sp. ChNu-99 TaxID=2839897 RepID=UPI002405DE56|nr:hypothetical protein [Nocardioides sp. ChNu-99]MDF9716040.1 hypothetical protein [Nocardioides sp. ChNu-99]
MRLEITTVVGTIDLGVISGQKGDKGEPGPGADVTGAQIEAARVAAQAAALEAAERVAGVVPAAQQAARDTLIEHPEVVQEAATAAAQKALEGEGLLTREDAPDLADGELGIKLDGDEVYGMRWKRDGSGAQFAGGTYEQLDADDEWAWKVSFADPDGRRRIGMGIRKDGTRYPDFDQLMADVARTTPVVRWGDSLTQDSEPTETDLEALLDRPVLTFGWGGRTPAQVAARQGGAPALVTAVTGNTIPAAGSVTMTLDRLPGIIATLSVEGEVLGVRGTMLITGTSGETAQATFTRTTPGLPVPVPLNTAGTVVIPTAFQTGERYRDCWPIIGCGRNGANVTSNHAPTVTAIRAMLDYAGPIARRHALVWDVPPDATEPYASAARAPIDALNTLIREAFPTVYVPVYAMLRSAELMTSIGVNPTAQDTTDIANGVTPTSLRRDSLHLNESGYKALNRIVHRTYLSKGWATA